MQNLNVTHKYTANQMFFYHNRENEGNTNRTVQQSNSTTHASFPLSINYSSVSPVLNAEQPTIKLRIAPPSERFNIYKVSGIKNHSYELFHRYFSL